MAERPNPPSPTGVNFLLPIESQRVTVINMAARTCARASGRSGCEDILLKILKFCLQNDTEAKININPDKLRSIVEAIEEGILVNI